MTNNNQQSIEEYLQEKRTKGREAYKPGTMNTFEKVTYGLMSPFRWGAEGLTSLLLRMQDSSLDMGEAYGLAQGDRTGREWYEPGDKPATLGQSFYGLTTPSDIDWRNTDQVQKFFSKDSQKFISGGIDAVTSVFLDPLNYTGVGPGLKGAALFGMSAKMMRGGKLLNLKKLENLSAKQFTSVSEWMKANDFAINADYLGGFRFGTKEYFNEIKRMEPFFKNWDEFSQIVSDASVKELSSSARYTFDGAQIRAIDKSRAYTWDAISSKWVDEVVLSPAIADNARNVSGTENLGITYSYRVDSNSFDDIQNGANILKIKTVDDEVLPAGAKSQVWRMENGDDLIVAYAPENNQYWVLSDKQIGDMPSESSSFKIVDDTQDLNIVDEAQYDLLSYLVKNMNSKLFKDKDFKSSLLFVKKDQLLKEFPEYSGTLNKDNYFLITTKDGFKTGDSGLDVYDPQNIVIYSYNSKTKKFSYLDDINNPEAVWTDVKKPKGVTGIDYDSAATLEKQTRVNEEFQLRAASAKQIEEYDDLVNTVDDIDWDAPDTGWETGSGGIVNEAGEQIGTEVLPSAGKRNFRVAPADDYLEIEQKKFAAFEKRWYPATREQLKPTHYRLTYKDQFGKSKEVMVPFRFIILSRPEKGNDILAPVFQNKETGKYFGLNFEGKFAPIDEVHLENQMYQNKVLKTELDFAVAEAITIKNKLKEEKVKLSDEEINALREQEGYKTTIEEARSFDNSVIERDNTITRALWDDPERLSEYEDAVEGFESSVSLGFWLKTVKNKDGTVTITAMMRRTTYTDKTVEKVVESIKDTEMFTFPNVKPEDLSQFISMRSNYGKANGDVWFPFKRNDENEIIINDAWDRFVGGEEPRVFINADEAKAFGVPETEVVGNPMVNQGRDVRRWTYQKRNDLPRWSGYNRAFKEMKLEANQIVKRIASIKAQLEKGRSVPNADEIIANGEKRLDFFRQYYRTEEDYQEALIDGMIPAADRGNSLTEIWFLNTVDVLNRITGSKFSVHNYLNTPTKSITKVAEATSGLKFRKMSKAENAVFVFGSNLKGIHGSGAALTAKQTYGAVQGTGKGLMGKSYALPTKYEPYKTMTLEEIKPGIDEFIQHAKDNPDKVFYLTSIGTGRAGHSAEDIASLFDEIPDNVVFADEIGGAPNRLGKAIEANLNNSKSVKTAEPTPIVTDKVTNVTNSSAVTIHSGGADGADTEWAIAGDEVGISTKGYSFKGHTTNEGMSEKSAGFKGSRPDMEERVVLTDEELLSNREELLAAGENIHYAYNKFIPSGKTVSKQLSSLNRLIYRNAYQVNNSDAVIAVGRFAKRNNDSFRRNVDGGTGWAVELGIVQDKPVYFYDLDSNKWINFDYSQNDWVAIEGLPPAFNNFAGIGTRGLTQQGKQAIRDYLSQFKKAE